MKTCTVCNAEKPRSEFHNDRRKNDGKTSACKPCAKARASRHYYEKRREREISSRRLARQERRGAYYERGVTKHCSRCGEPKPWVEFGEEPRALDGKQSACKACVSAAHRARWPAIRAEANANRVRWSKVNRDRERARVQAWHEAHPDRVRAHKRRYRERIRKEKPWVLRANLLAYRARKSRAPGPHTRAELDARIAFYGGRCWICSADAVAMDHVKPITKGGSNWPANLRPICHCCNARKSNIWPLSPALLMSITRRPDPDASRTHPETSLVEVRFAEVTDSGPFDFRWPATLEHFASGWEGGVYAGGRRFAFRHGVGERDVYGRLRVHTVTFLDGHAVVEGVAADDFGSSRALLTLLKIGSGHTLVRGIADVPVGYDGLEIVSHRDEIDAPYSRRCLALKIRVDDLESWAAHAVRRRAAQGR